MTYPSDEDPWRASSDDDEYTVEADSSIYMCGHGGWHVRRRDRPGILVSFTGGPYDAARLRDLLNGRDVGAPVEVRPPPTRVVHRLANLERQKRRHDGPIVHRYRCACGVTGGWKSTRVEAANAHATHVGDVERESS